MAKKLNYTSIRFKPHFDNLQLSRNGIITAFKAGVANECAGLLAIYPGLPTRTPPNIQAILTLSLIPFTVLVRYLMIKQGNTL